MPLALNPREMTQLLIDWSNGDKSALDRLVPLVHEELRKLAHHYMSKERSDHTLQTTALVNEFYLRLVDQQSVSWENRAHFFGIAARSMRQILVEYARRRESAKRGGGRERIELDEAALLSKEPDTDLIALDEALNELAAIDERKSRVVELRFFGGLGVEEIAEALHVHSNTVVRDWDMAKAWLRRRLAPRTI
ncbi:MAG TPA: sigma-70 family RNA polymerase sigma factor [Pyrinomonadaceae bacterium]|nr:sigma-70 family RNA polymerase sigma factor [Pyrinomonadaceae bacterium]